MFTYNDENRLSAVQVSYVDTNGVPQGWRTEFEYDGLGRLRWRWEFLPGGYAPARPLVAGSWNFDHGVEYLYDVKGSVPES